MRRRSPMHRFMRQRRRMALSVSETLERRHLNEIQRRREECLIATVPDGRTGVDEERIDMSDALRRRDARSRTPIIVIRQILNLIEAEHRIGAGLHRG